MGTQLAATAAVTQLRKAHRRLVAVALSGACAPAYAQIEKVNTVMTNVQNVLAGVSVSVFTIAFMWVGFKMAFQHAKWAEVSNIAFGGIMAGGAAGIASWLLG